MERLGILMLGGAKRVSVGRMFMDAGSQLGYDVELYSYELDRKVPISEIAEIIIGRRWTDDDVVEHINDVVETNRINIIVPFVDGAIGVAARCKSYKLFAPVGDKKVVDTMFDKVSADKFFRKFAIPLPDLRRPADGIFPIIAKPACGSASKGIKILRNELDLEFVNAEEEYIFQEYISDREEYTVDCYVSSAGKVVAAVPRRRIETAGGEATRTVTVADHEVIRLSDMVLRAVGLTGAVTLQFIRDKSSGRTMLMEINPRLGGGVVCAVHAGANIPEMIIREWAEMDLIPARWTPGIEIARYFQEVVFKN